MTRLDTLKRASQRISTTIPYTVYSRLVTAADDQGRSASNFCAYLIERGLDTFYPETTLS